MKKINGLVLSALTAAFLVGCGGGSSSGSSSSSSSGTNSGGSTTPALSATDVTVERGAVYGSTVTDANGQVATQKTGTNVYTFATTPVYPITASGGIIDIDNNGIDEGDIELTTVLTSYSNVVTPITTYLGNPATDSGKAKLAKLKEIAGVASDDDFFKKAPSELLDDVGTNVLVLTNALFDIMNDGDTSNDDFVSSYTGSAFETKFAELKTEAVKYTDKKEMAKALEEKVITYLGLESTKLSTADLANTTTTATLKVADLKRFVSYDGEEYWYDDNTVADGKITFKSYSFMGSAASPNGEWILDKDYENDYVTITPDATNPYKFSYVDPITKEEGTFTILSTKQVPNYSDLYKTKTKREVTKMGTELDWYRWDWVNPTNWDNATQKSTPITDIDGLYTYFSQSENAIVTKETDRVVYTSHDGKEHSYYKLVQENGNYYIEAADLEDVGYIEQEAIFTGTSLDEFVNYIKAPAPLFTSSQIISVPENQTSVYTVTVTDSLKVTYSLDGTDDASLFTIDSETGVVTFVTAPDYESTTHRPFYNFIVKATNSAGKYTRQGVSVRVTDLDEQTTTPTTPVTTTSFVSGKIIVFNDSEGSMTSTFNSNFTYSESGNHTCSGLWKDLGNNKIGVTCQDNGTTEVPDGVIDANSNEITILFSSTTPATKQPVTFQDAEGSKNGSITAISDIAK